ncbi:hypothetical protein DC522_08400 [Microvirga sp. KLBC 81]|uniref:DUF2270 domain-containing protein n=1 Tax=Microvirga sp. KLBC 81 TaxID=1862707 RepID=UPI000D51AEE1|nr:DUF2270 domain-containing protein [Microvirga sp. KLBC 81]PVE24930.1 hypothetical protein DC522_08400 [Microvirga sp. KLBC 81]
MLTANDQRATSALKPTITPPVFPGTPTEFINLIAHYHRAEIARMAGWRDRIDRTTNWAITVVAAMLSVSLSTPTAHHGVLLFAMILVLLLLVIEARRYRFFDVYRNRVRRMERNYYAQIFSPEDGTTDDWIHKLGDDLRKPLFLIGLNEAISRRLRRNYCWMFLILLLAWLVKTTFIRMQDSAMEAHIVTSVGEWVRNAAVGPVPGWAVIVAVTIFYGWILYASLRQPKGEGELAFGNVHV